MNTPKNSTAKNRAETANAAAAGYRRRIARAEAANWKYVVHTDPATGRAQAINIRHS